MDEPLARQEQAGGSGPDNGAERVHGIVLAGTYNWNASGLDALTLRPLLPVAQSALITYALRWLRDGRVTGATVCTNGPSRDVRAYLGDGAWLNLSLAHHEDATPRGTAGSVRDASLGHEAETLVVTDGTSIPSVDLGRLLEDHRRQGAALTVVVHPQREPGYVRRPLNPDGLYVMDRRALEFVPGAGFHDIKENLIPRLYRAGERVVTHKAQRRSPRVINDRFRMLDPANLPEKPYSPKPLLVLGLGAVLGLFVGLGAAVGAEALDATVKNADDLTSLQDCPVLACIPHVRALGPGRP